MAELTITTFLSLDGVMQAPGAPDEDTSGHFSHGGWVFPYADEAMVRTMVEIFARADAFLLGRTTYDIFAAYWPKVTDPDDPIASKLNALPKFIASRTRTRFDWQHCEPVADVEHHVQGIKARYAREVQVHGSGGLAQTLIRHDLIDVYRLLTFPVVLGSGKRLFADGAVPAALKLMDCRTTPQGVVIAEYRRAGKLRTGSFTQAQG